MLLIKVESSNFPHSLIAIMPHRIKLNLLPNYSGFDFFAFYMTKFPYLVNPPIELLSENRELANYI